MNAKGYSKLPVVVLFSVGCSALPAIAADLDGGLIILQSAVKSYTTACSPVKDYVTDQSDRLWQHRWCPIRAVVDGKTYVARHDYFHADNGTTYVFKNLADWWNCSDMKDNKPVIPPVTYGLQCP